MAKNGAGERLKGDVTLKRDTRRRRSRKSSTDGCERSASQRAFGRRPVASAIELKEFFHPSPRTGMDAIERIACQDIRSEGRERSNSRFRLSAAGGVSRASRPR